ncbi:MAG: flagellar hook-basal body complex protein FliE [Deltaproteobacteria bacterium]|nr:flagellar hook-basal body complex protein FliE [Deltaproteobacteria bacterium]
MTDMKITGIGGVGISASVKNPVKGTAGFDDILKDAVGKISQVQKDAETAVRELSTGGDVTSAIIAMERADMTFQLMVEARNRLLSAYEEIMRMQI